MEPIWYRGNVALIPSALVDEDALAKATERGFEVETFENARGKTIVLKTVSTDLDILKAMMLDLMSVVNWATYTVEACLINSVFENKWNVPRNVVVKGIA